jgi:peptide/nickel transport system permease protein
MGIAAIGILLVIILASVFANFIAHNDPGHANLQLVSSPPGHGYLLGGDSAGRDIFARLLYAGRVTLLGAVVVGAVSSGIGVIAGLIAGYRGKGTDLAVSWISDLVMVLPSMVVLVALFTVIGPNAIATMVILGVMLAPSFYRLTRSLVRGVKNNLYVDAARVSGLSDGRILVRHVLRVVRAPLVIHLSLVVAAGILIQTGLDFLGLGDSRVPTWGGMLQDAFLSIYRAPTQFVWPGLIVGLVVGSLILLGNALRDALEDLDVPPVAVDVAPVATTQKTPDDAGSGLLSVQGLTIGYSAGGGGLREVVNGVDFEVASGEIVGLVGESGSGKTQTALAILRLLPTGGTIMRGRVLLDGKDLAQLSEKEMNAVRGASVAYIPQEPMSNLDPSFRIGYQLTEPLRVRRGMSREQAKAAALDLLRQVNIVNPERVFDSYPHEISGGMAQRVLIAGAVSCDPDLIIADEPTTALDVTVQAEILDILRRLQRDRKLAVLMITHNFGVVADLCDRVVVMQLGDVVERAGVHEVFASPQHPYTKLLLGASLDGRPSRRQRDEERVATRRAVRP